MLLGISTAWGAAYMLASCDAMALSAEPVARWNVCGVQCVNQMYACSGRGLACGKAGHARSQLRRGTGAPPRLTLLEPLDLASVEGVVQRELVRAAVCPLALQSEVQGQCQAKSQPFSIASWRALRRREQHTARRTR